MIFQNVELYNVQNIFKNDQGILLSRIPDDLRLKLNESAQKTALHTAGCEIRFNLKGDRARIVLESRENPFIVELYQGCFFTGSRLIGKDPTEICISLPENIEELKRVAVEENFPFDTQLTRIILPWNSAAKLIEVKGNVTLPGHEQTPPVKYLAYGSSITHGTTAIRPTGSYAMQTAQALSADLINLGFGGSAFLEREMADYIASRNDWTFASLEMGINLIGRIETDEFFKRVEYFIPAIAKSHPDNWIFCIDLFTCRRDYAKEPKVIDFRNIVKKRVAELNMPKLVYLPGTEILTSARRLMTDLIHPSPAGMTEIAENLSRMIRDRIG